MTEHHGTRGSNLLLRSLSVVDRQAVLTRVNRIALERQQLLIAAHQPIQHVYFPEGGIVSVTTATSQQSTEVGVVGREGMVGWPLLLGDDRTPNNVFVQVDGTEALRLTTASLLELVGQSETLRRALLRFTHAFVIQLGQTIAANAHCGIEARLARWLLMCHDRVESDQFHLTHEFMAMMIGAQRSGVTLALHVLEGVGSIRSSRGLVEIRNRAQLEELAGASYGVAEQEYRRLVGPFGGPLP